MPAAKIHIRMRVFAFLLTIALLPPGIALAQRLPQLSPGYRIAGTILNAATGEPVRRANLALLAVEDSRTVAAVESDTDGHFSFEHLPAAKFQLTASKRGFRTSFYDQHEDFNTAIVTGPTQNTSSLSFRIVPGGALRGVVTTDGGDPVENAQVLLFQKPVGSKISARPARSDSTNTDDAGAYEFNDLSAGEYFLAVMAQPWYALHRNASTATSRPSTDASSNDPSVALDVAYPITYFDSTTDEATAASLTVAGGSRQQADITLHAVPALHIKVDTPRKANGSVSRAELRQTIFGAVVGAQSGGFLNGIDIDAPLIEFSGVAPGHYELAQGNPPRIAQLDATASQQIDPALGTAAGSIHGAFRTPAGAPLSVDAGLVLEPATGATAAAVSPIQGSAAQGAFNFESVPPGDWQLTAFSGGQTLPIASISAAGRTLRGNLISVPDHALSIVVTVTTGATRVEGFARKDGKAAPGVMVVFVPKDSAAIEGLARRDQSDSDGSFALRDVVPGRYTLIAIDDGWPLDWTDPHTLARYLPGGVPVTVSDKSGKLISLSNSVPVQNR